MLSASQRPAMNATSERVLVMVVAGAVCVKHHRPTIVRTRLDTLKAVPFLAEIGCPINRKIILLQLEGNSKQKNIDSCRHATDLRSPGDLGIPAIGRSLVWTRVEHLIQTLHPFFLFFIVSFSLADDSTGNKFVAHFRIGNHHGFLDPQLGEGGIRTRQYVDLALGWHPEGPGERPMFHSDRSLHSIYLADCPCKLSIRQLSFPLLWHCC